MLSIDLKGKRAFVAGIADDQGFGFAIAKALYTAGATICVGTWPPAYSLFQRLLRSGRIKDSLALSDGRTLEFEQIYPLDVQFDTLDSVPKDVRESRRYAEHGDFSVQGVADQLAGQLGGQCLDIVVHSIANGPEVARPLLETTREGYLSAQSASAYSFVSMVQRFGPLLRPRSSALCLSYLGSERVVIGYGGGMSSAKASLEADTRVLAYEAGRKFGARINCISAGPLASRAASAIGAIERLIAYSTPRSALPEAITAREVGDAAAFLCSPLASGISGATLYVDKGFHAVAVPGIDEG